jgi:hypothetical protein
MIRKAQQRSWNGEESWTLRNVKERWTVRDLCKITFTFQNRNKHCNCHFDSQYLRFFYECFMAIEKLLLTINTVILCSRSVNVSHYLRLNGTETGKAWTLSLSPCFKKLKELLYLNVDMPNKSSRYIIHKKGVTYSTLRVKLKVVWLTLYDVFREVFVRFELIY